MKKIVSLIATSIIFSGCVATDNVTLIEPTVGVTLGSTIINSIACNGDTNGTANVNPIGGTANFTYEWSTGDTTESIPVDTSLTIVCVTITDANDCSYSESFTVNSTVSINENSASDIKLYYNSMLNQVQIENWNLQERSIVLYSASGAVIKNYNMNSNQKQTIQLPTNLTSGMYFLINNAIRFKIVK